MADARSVRRILESSRSDLSPEQDDNIEESPVVIEEKQNDDANPAVDRELENELRHYAGGIPEDDFLDDFAFEELLDELAFEVVELEDQIDLDEIELFKYFVYDPVKLTQIWDEINSSSSENEIQPAPLAAAWNVEDVEDILNAYEDDEE